MDNKQDRRSNEKGAAPMPAPEETIVASDHREVASAQQSISDQTLVDRIDRSDRWMIWLTGTIAATGIVSAVIFGGQLTVMQGQLDEMNKTFVSDRAYIFGYSVLRDTERQIENGYPITVKFKNFGRTPAVVTRSSTSGCRYYSALPSPLVKKDIGSLPISYPVGGGEEAPEMRGAVAASSAEIVRASNGDGSIRCVFNMDYDDVRGGHHKTGMCILLSVKPNYAFQCPEPDYRNAYQNN